MVAIVTAAAVLVAMGFDAGGYFPATYLYGGAAAFAVLAVLLAVRTPRWRPSTHALIALGSLAALAAWTGIAVSWSPAPGEGQLAFERAIAYVGLFGLAVVGAGSGRHARLTLWAALGVASVLVVAGLLSRLAPDIVSGSAPELARTRLAWPLSYWNAFGTLASLGAILAVGLAADPRAHPVARAGLAALAVLLVVAMYFSLSRGAWLALFAGLVALLALGAHRRSLALTLAVVGGASVLAILRLRGYPELVDELKGGAEQESAGHEFGGQLLVLVGATAAVQFALARARTSVPVMDAVRRFGRPLTVGLAVLGLAASVGVYAVAAATIEGRTAKSLDDGADWVSRQWDDFLATSNLDKAPGAGTARLTTSRGTRSDLFRVAIDGFEDHPLRGDGAGAYHVRWLRTREVDEEVRDAHSLGLETLSELGAVGAIALLAFLGALVAAAVRARVRPGSLRRSEAAAAGAAVIVWVAHSMIDWDWQMPALTGTALLVAAALLPPGRWRVRRRTVGRQVWRSGL